MNQIGNQQCLLLNNILEEKKALILSMNKRIEEESNAMSTCVFVCNRIVMIQNQQTALLKEGEEKKATYSTTYFLYRSYIGGHIGHISRM